MNFHISAISTAKILFGVIDQFAEQSYKGRAKAFESSESRRVRQAKAWRATQGAEG